MKILIINGPNLNLLGNREKEIYGEISFESYFNSLKKDYSNVELEVFQSNHEGEIIDKLQDSDKTFNGVVLNAAAYTHTSLAIQDAIKAISVDVIEVHISNIYNRESIRQKSLIAPVCMGSISGFGLLSYELAIQALIKQKK